MSDQGKTQLTVIFTAPADLVAEGDRLFASHAKWMRNTHTRDGEKGLLLYNLVKGPELSNAMDPSSKPTGNTCFVLTEVYETPAGVADHWKQLPAWEDVSAVAARTSKVKVTTLHCSPIVHSLW